ncbi:hypothetical protein ACJBU6_10504 [Exserohilum turcicum]
MKIWSCTHTHPHTHAIYGSFPSCAAAMPSQPSRAPSPHSPSKTPARPKPALPADFHLYRPQNILIRNNAAPTWLPYLARRTRPGHAPHMDIHQSVCLNFRSPCDDSTESELWILPELDDWEADDSDTDLDASQPPSRPAASSPPTPERHQSPRANEKQWSIYLHRAAKSNLERLRARLEGDGWHFIGARCGDPIKDLHKSSCQSDERLDEEFDVVVLSAVRASC